MKMHEANAVLTTTKAIEARLTALQAEFPDMDIPVIAALMAVAGRLGDCDQGATVHYLTRPAARPKLV